MAKGWRLTRRAQQAMLEIARWTVDTFGPRQAVAYEDDLVARFAAIAAGTVPSQSCRTLAGTLVDEDPRFARGGQHSIVFMEEDDGVVIVDLLHVRSGLPTRLAQIGGQASH